MDEIKVDKSSGTGNSSVKVTVTGENKRKEVRRATVQVVTAGGMYRSAEIVQEPAYYMSDINLSTWGIPADGGQVVVDGLEWETTYAWYGLIILYDEDNEDSPFIEKAEIGVDGKNWADVPITAGTYPAESPVSVFYKKILPERDGLHKCSLRLKTVKNTGQERAAFVFVCFSETGESTTSDKSKFALIGIQQDGGGKTGSGD